jgi:hypothetical protein
VVATRWCTGQPSDEPGHWPGLSPDRPHGLRRTGGSAVAHDSIASLGRDTFMDTFTAEQRRPSTVRRERCLPSSEPARPSPTYRKHHSPGLVDRRGAATPWRNTCRRRQEASTVSSSTFGGHGYAAMPQCGD